MIHVIHLTLYDCDISRCGSIIFHEKGLGIEGRGLGVKVVMKNGCRGWVNVKNLDNVLSLFTLFIYKCMNITIKQMKCLSCIYKCLWGLYPTA